MKDCVFDLETTLSTFMKKAKAYLRRINTSFVNAVDIKNIQEAIAAISNIKYTNRLLTNDKFKQILTDIKDIFGYHGEDLNEELRLVSLDKM